MNTRAVSARPFELVMALRAVYGIDEARAHWLSRRRKSLYNAKVAIYVPDTTEEYEQLIAQLVARKLR